jgi:DNA-binding transcriptional regulator GbsR (MarR family)
MRKVIRLTERQLNNMVKMVLLREDSMEMEEEIDVWEKDLDGKFFKRYRSNDKEDVKRIQKMLLILGYEVGPHGVDGIYGPDTARAVKRFQEDIFVDPLEWDKIVGPKTYSKLYEMVEEVAIDNDLDIEEIIELTGDEGYINYEDENDDDAYDYEDENDDYEDENDDDAYDYEEEIEDEEYEEYDDQEYDYLADEIIDKASEQIGQPYSWGCEFDTENEKAGGDCSGLIDWTFRHIPELESPGRDTTSKLQKSPGFIKGKNNWDEVQKGDVLLFYGKNADHTGFVANVEGDRVDMIHSAASKWDEDATTGTQLTRDIFNTQYVNHRGKRKAYFRDHYIGYIPYEYFKVDEELTEEHIQRMVQLVVEDYSPGDEVELRPDNSDQDGDDIPDRLDSDDDNDGQADEEGNFNETRRFIKRFIDTIYDVQKRYGRGGRNGSYEIQKEIKRLVQTVTQLNLSRQNKKRFLDELEEKINGELKRVMDRREIYNVMKEITQRIN